MVRLVRACGSKQKMSIGKIKEEVGQARKSLWIDTFVVECNNCVGQVRLVRACGSKQRP